MQNDTDEASLNSMIRIASGSHGSEIKEQIVKEHEIKINSCSFWSDSTTVLQRIQRSHRKQQIFVAKRVAEILDKTDVSQLKHVSAHQQPSGHWHQSNQH